MKKYTFKIWVFLFLVFLANILTSFAEDSGCVSTMSGASASFGNNENEEEYLLKIKLKPKIETKELEPWKDKFCFNSGKQRGQWEFDLLSSQSNRLPALVLNVSYALERSAGLNTSNFLILDDPVEIILLNPMDRPVKSNLAFSLESVVAGQELQVNLNDFFVGFLSCSDGGILVRDLVLSPGINIITLSMKNITLKQEAKPILSKKSVKCGISPSLLEDYKILNKVKSPGSYIYKENQRGGVNVLSSFSRDSQPYFLMNQDIDIQVSDYCDFVFSFSVAQSPFDSIKVFLAFDYNKDNLIDGYIEILDNSPGREKMKNYKDEYVDLLTLLKESSIDIENCRLKKIVLAAYSKEAGRQKDLLLEIGKFDFLIPAHERKLIFLPLGLVDWDNLQVRKDEKVNFFHYINKEEASFVVYFRRDSLQQEKQIKYEFIAPNLSVRPELVKVIYKAKVDVSQASSFYLQVDKDADGNTDGEILIGERRKLQNWNFVRSSQDFDEYETALPEGLSNEKSNFSVYKYGCSIQAVSDGCEDTVEKVVLDRDRGVLKLYIPKGSEFENHYDMIICDYSVVGEDASYVVSMDLDWFYEFWPDVKFKSVKVVLDGRAVFDAGKQDKSNWSSLVLEEIGFFSPLFYNGDMVSVFEKFLKDGKTPLVQIDDKVIRLEGADSLTDKGMFEKGMITKKIKLSSGKHSYRLLKNDAFEVERIILEPCKSLNVSINEGPELIFKRLNPAKYIVDVKNATQPFWLVLCENYSRQWSLYQVPSSYFDDHSVKGQKFLSYKNGAIQEAASGALFDLMDASFLFKKSLEFQQYKGNGFSNVWYVDPEKNDLGPNFSIVIFFKPQAVYCLGLIISLSFFILALFILIVKKIFR